MKGAAIRLGILVLLNLAGIRLMAHYRVMETLLAPGPHSGWLPVCGALGFLLARFALVFLGPGLVLVALWKLRQASSGSPGRTPGGRPASSP